MIDSPPDEPRPAVSVVVPVYNSEGSLKALAGRVEGALSAQPGGYELILVNDGSADGSWPAIRELARQRPSVRGLDLGRNCGQQAALRAGIEACRGAVIVTMDDDLQHPPEELPRLLARLAEGYDVVYGVAQASRHPLWRRVAGRLYRLTLEAARARLPPGVGAFRAFRATLRPRLADERSATIDTALGRASGNVGTVAVRHDRSARGPSRYSLPALVRLAWDLAVPRRGRP